MAKRLIIIIRKAEIYEEVGKLMAYAGKKQTDATGDTSYDVMHITKAEEEMLDQFFDSAVNELEDTLKTYLEHTRPDALTIIQGKADDEEDEDEPESAAKEPGVTMVCRMPDSWDVELRASTVKTAKEWLASYVASKWLRLTKPDREAAEAGEADNKMSELKRKLYWRRRPQMKHREDEGWWGCLC